MIAFVTYTTFEKANRTINDDTLVKMIMHINIEICEKVKFLRQKLCDVW